MADQPGVRTTPSPFHVQVRADLSTLAIKPMAFEATLPLRCLTMKGCQNVGVLGPSKIARSDDVIETRGSTNIEVVGGVQRNRVA